MAPDTCFQSIFDKYLEIVSISKVLSTNTVSDNQIPELNNRFDTTVSQIRDTINKECMTQTFHDKNLKCYRAFNSKFTRLTMRLSILDTAPASRNYLTYAINVISNFWAPSDWK